MAPAPLSIKLRCTSWGQLATIYKRDLARGALFLRSSKPPPIGTHVKIDMTLPSETTIALSGVIVEQVGEGGMGGRGPGVDIKLAAIPQSAMWLIETALSAHRPPSPSPTSGSVSQAAPRPPGPGPTHTSVSQAAAAVRAPSPTGREAVIEEGEDLAAAERELLAALTAELTSLQRLNPFQVLGVGYESDDADVRNAFGELTRRYHPDRYAKYPSLDLRKLASELFILIRDAYRKIDSAKNRAQTLAQLGRGPRVIPVPPVGTRPATIPPTQRAPSNPAIAKGVSVPNLKPPGGPPKQPPRATPPGGVAINTPAKATPVHGVPVTPEDPMRVRAMTQATIASQRQRAVAPAGPGLGEMDGAALDELLDAARYDQALALCQAALSRNPGDRVAKVGVELVEGLRALADRDRMEAAQRFEAVLEIDPSNERAARELAEMRRMATSERKGLLSKLLGKKE